jgi:excisionase family DNA binding protein
MTERREPSPARHSEAAPTPGQPSAKTAGLTNRPIRSRRPAAVAACSLEALPSLLTIDEVAAVLRTSRKAIYAMAERAHMPGLVRIGRRLLVRRDDLLSWLDERRAASPGGTRR